MSDWYSTKSRTIPCWFYNNGGCKKDVCDFAHVIMKPFGTKTKLPCWYHHINGECKFGEDCIWDHEELSTKEWRIYFPNINKMDLSHAKDRSVWTSPNLKMDLGHAKDRPNNSNFWGGQDELNKDLIRIKRQLVNIKNVEITKDLLRTFVITH